MLTLNSGENLNFNGITNLKNIETIDLVNGGNAHTIDNLGINDVLSMTDENNTLTILGDNNDTVNLLNGDGGVWAMVDTINENGDTFNVFQKSGSPEDLTLKIEDTVQYQIA